MTGQCFGTVLAPLGTPVINGNASFGAGPFLEVQWVFCYVGYDSQSFLRTMATSAEISSKEWIHGNN